MQIFSISFLNNKPQAQKKSPSFQKLDKFASIKQIEGLTCACCGDKVLSANKYAQIITPLSKSLHIAMRKGHLNFVRALFPESWNLLKHFTYKYPNQSLDVIMDNAYDYNSLKKSVVNTLDNPELKPQTKERFELDRKISTTFFNILSHGRSNMKESPIVFETISPLKPMLNGLSKEIYELLENYSKIYPDKTLSEIIEEVQEIHEPKSTQFREENLKIINDIFENIKNIAQKHEIEIEEELNKARDEIMGIYNNEEYISDRIHDIKRIYSKMLNKKHAAFLFHKIIKEIEKLPQTINNVDTFITDAYKYKYTDSRILTKIFQPFTSSEVKIISLDNHGTNKLGNKIVMCNQCVKKLNNAPYSIFVKHHPEMIENMQKQMNTIVNEILAKNLDGNFRFYPLIISLRLREATNSAIKLDLVDYCNKILEDSKINIQNLEEKIKNFEKECKEKEALITDYPGLENDLRREMYRINEKIEKAKEQIQIELNLQNYIENYFEYWEKRY